MTNNEVHLANSNMRGTVFDTPSDNPLSPIRRGMITIDGCMIRLLVYPERRSAKGNMYNPIQLQYTDCGKILKAVPANG